MKNIAIIIPSLEVGGAERMVTDLAKGLNKEIFNVNIVCLYDSKDNEIEISNNDNVNVIRLNKIKGFDPRIIFRMTKLFMHLKPDVVHTHLYTAPYAAIPTIVSRCKVRIHTIHSTTIKELPKSKRWIMYILYKYLGFEPIAITDFLVNDIKKCYGIKRKDIHLIRNGVDVNKYRRTDFKSNSNVVLVSVGRLVTIKNHILLLNAFLRAKNEYSSLFLKIAGYGPEFNNLKQFIESNGLTETVELLGNCSDVPKLLRESDVYVSTSLVEGLPLTIIEAMATSMPIIATPAGGTVDLVSKNNGYLVGYDYEQISKIILKMAKNKKNIKLMGNNSMRIVNEKYTLKQMVTGYEKIYNKT